MNIEPFKLERFFAEYEFSIKYQMSNSDCESMTIGELLRLGGEKSQSDFLSLYLAYTESRGYPPLRQAVSALYSGIPADNILIAAPEEAIFLTLHAHLGPRDHVIVMTPSYQSLEAVPQSIGCRITRWPVQLVNGRWELDFNLLKESLTPDTRMLIINAPHNPTGLCFSHEEKLRIVELLRPTKTLLFADEMYWQLEYGENVSAAPFCDLYDRAVSLSGFSKSYGLPGLRIGWLASQSEDLLSPAAALKDYTTICSSAPSELLALTALEHGSYLIEKNMGIVRKNLAAVRELGERYPSLDIIPGQGGSVIFPRLQDGQSAEELSRRLIEHRDLLILPGNLFDMPDNFFRIGLGRANLPDILRVFEKEL